MDRAGGAGQLIGRIAGRVLGQEADGVVVVDVNGVGYELVVPMGTVGRAPHEAERATFLVHTHVREDAIVLFGFANEADRAAFRALISVSNVGPKTAIAVLSALPGPELARAIASRDVAKLTSISGVGKKTAERLVLELKDKIKASGLAGARPSQPPPAGAGADALLSALVNLGYRPSAAERTAEAVRRSLGPAAPLEDQLREALRLIS